MIRVVVADDSAVVRQAIIAILESDPGITVVGAARHGGEAVSMVSRLNPDLVTMDIRMPVMNGFEAVKQIMKTRPTPVVVVSASVNDEDLQITFKAIEAGALAILEKPKSVSHRDYQDIRKALIEAVTLMSQVKVVGRRLTATGRRRSRLVSSGHSPGAGAVVAIGSSTGGPMALSSVLSQIPREFPAPIVVVQHIMVGFGRALADWLDTTCVLTVKIAESGEKIQPGTVYLAPDNRNLGISDSGTVRLSALSGNHHASVNYLFNSVAKSFGRRVLGVLLTGMGEDGAKGMQTILAAGGHTVAQDQGSCIVFGMPKAAIDLGAVERIVPLDHIPQTLCSLLSTNGNGRRKVAAGAAIKEEANG